MPILGMAREEAGREELALTIDEIVAEGAVRCSPWPGHSVAQRTRPSSLGHPPAPGDPFPSRICPARNRETMGTVGNCPELEAAAQRPFPDRFRRWRDSA